MANKILYGDDNEQNREIVERNLRLRNYEVDLAETPQEFLEKAKTNSYHTLVTDLEYTPRGGEGYGVLKQVRELPILKILFSGVSGFEYQAEAYESGADFAVLGKDSSELVKILDKELNLGGKE